MTGGRNRFKLEPPVSIEAAVASASTDETAPPYPVEVDGAGGAGRPAATEVPGGAVVGTADAGAPAAITASEVAAARATPARRSERRRSTVTMSVPPEVVTYSRFALP